MPLNSNQVKSLQPGSHADGGGLYLVVRDSGERVWAFRFTGPDGKRAQMEFAKVGDRDSTARDVLSLSSAREEVRHYRTDLKRNGTDPRARKRLNAAGGKTVLEFATQQYPTFCVGRSAEEEKQWVRSIRDMTDLHQLKVHDVTTELARDALQKIWTEKPVTANRTRQRFERLFDAAKVLNLRTGENPFVWRGNLKHLLPQAIGKRGLHKKKHHASLPYAKAPALMTALHYDTGNAARCVEVGILTATRSQEIRLMEWNELDLDDQKTWLIPAEKMKIKQDESGEAKNHLVPLSDQAIAIIKSMPRVGRYVFPSDAKQVAEHTPFLANALTGAIDRTGLKSTMHGLRATFRNWAGDSKANYHRDVVEFCMAHRVGDEAELSYWTSDMIERRREVMQAWADYVKPKAAKPALKVVA